mgnify:CR=1 FL=1
MIPEYVEQAGVYRNPETKRFMGTTEAESILDALNQQSALLQEIDENTEVSPEEERQRSLNEEQTDTPSRFAGLGGKIGDGLKSVGGFLKDKNPLSTDRNPITRLLGFGALAGLLKLFGDKLTGDEGFLTKILEWFKLTFIPWTVTTWNAIKEFDWEAQFAKVGAFFDKIKNFFVALDTDKDGVVSFDEIKEGFKGTVDTIKDKFEEGFKGFVEDYGAKILAAFVGYKIGKGLISALLFGGAPKVGQFAGLRMLGLAGVMVGGLYLLHNKIKDAYDEAITDENGNIQKFDAKQFISRLLSGEDNKEGMNWTSAFINSWDEAVAGAGVGLAAGLVTGGILSFPLAAVGFVTGGVLGMMGHHMGEDRLNDALDSAEKGVKQTGDDLVTTANTVLNWARGIVDSAKAILDPDQTITGAFRLATKGDGAQLYKEADKEVRQLEEAIKLQEIQKANFLKTNPEGNTINFDNALKSMNEQLRIQRQRRDEAFQTAENVQTQTALNEYGSVENRLKELKATQRNLKPAAAARLQPEIDELEGRKRQLGLDFMKGNVFSATLDAGTLEQPEIKKFRGDNLNNKFNLITSATQSMTNKMQNFTQPPGQIINAPTSIRNEGDTHISTLSAVPAYSTANVLTETWTRVLHQKGPSN